LFVSSEGSDDEQPANAPSRARAKPRSTVVGAVIRPGEEVK
jgi:hypothetical protein